jgi:hypothetical protein
MARLQALSANPRRLATTTKVRELAGARFLPLMPCAVLRDRNPFTY